MGFHGQSVLPAIRSMKQFDRFLKSDFEYGVLLDSHLGQVKNLVMAAKASNKKLLIHVDLIQGIKNDEYAAEFLCQEVKPAGLISTRSSVIAKAAEESVCHSATVFTRYRRNGKKLGAYSKIPTRFHRSVTRCHSFHY